MLPMMVRIMYLTSYFRNLAKMLGWKTPSPITKEQFLDTVLDRYEPQYSGESIGVTPAELNVEIYRRILMNTAYLFKSKGTRKAIEFLLRFIGAPEALTEFNEYVVLADARIKMGNKKDPRCNTLLALLNASTNIRGTRGPQGAHGPKVPTSKPLKVPRKVSEVDSDDGGTQGTLSWLSSPTWVSDGNISVIELENALELLGCYDLGPGFLNEYQSISGGLATNNVYLQDPMTMTTYISSTTESHGFIREDYPIDDDGFPTKPRDTSNYYFQRGAGWFEETEEHHGETIIDLENSKLTGCTPSIVTKLNQFSWGGFFGDLPPGVTSNDPGATLP